MSKRKITKNDDKILDKIELSDYFNDPMYDDQDDFMADMIKSLLDVSNEQMRIALELTKLSLQANAGSNSSQEKVFETFLKASSVVAENLPFKKLINQLDTEE